MKNTTTLRFFLRLFVFLLTYTANAQTPDPIQYSPGGLLDNVFDHYGNQYTLEDIKIPSNTTGGQQGRWTDPDCNAGMFTLHFDSGCGMINGEHPDAAARRAVVCKVFSDLSAFINGPLNHGASATKVNIWIRPFSSVSTSTSTQAMASGFMVYPSSPTAATVNGGILDNEIWKTIHTGVDSYLDYAAPLLAPPGSFYHGMVTINWDKDWNLDLSATTFTGIDLYTAVLHEVTHALGFASLIDSDGNSRLGAGNNYYSRYDTFLKDRHGVSLLETTNTCSSYPLYDYVFNTSTLDALHACPSGTAYDQDPWNCTSEINFVGSGNPVPVFNPACYKPGSSLSHFEDSCVDGQTNNQYFLMSNALPTNTPKRYPKEEEYMALSDIGYNLQDAFHGYSYTNSAAKGIKVAGRCDGLNGNNYTFMIASGSTLDLTGADLLNNDYSENAVGYECLQDVYHDDDATTTITGTSGNNGTSITFSSTATGVHLLRYVPYDLETEKRGNITYVFVYVNADSNNNSNGLYSCMPQPNTCNLVLNGDFEQHEIAPSDSFYTINLACGWIMDPAGLNLIYNTPWYFTDDGTFYWGVPQNQIGYQNDAISGNGAYTSINYSWVSTGCSFLEGRLPDPLLPNKTYCLTFDTSLGYNSNAYPRVAAYFNNQLVTILASNIQNVDTNHLFSSDKYTNSLTDWIHNTIVFNTGSSSDLQYLVLGNFINNLDIIPLNPPPYSNASYYIDNVSLVPLDYTFNPAMTQVCIDNPAVVLNNLVTPAMPPGATFGGAGVSIQDDIYTFDATTAGLGVHPITFTYTNSLGCPISVTQNITVVKNDIIVPVFLQLDPVCGGENFSLPTTSTNFITGSWSPAINNTATTTYTFTPNGGQCARSATMTVVVDPATAGTLSFVFGSQNICANGAAKLQSTVAGGVWSSSNTAVAQVQSDGFIMAMAAGTTTINYTTTNANGCVATVSMVLTIVSPPVIGSTIADNLCYDTALGTLQLWVGAGPTGITYQWYVQYASSSTITTTLTGATNSTILLGPGFFNIDSGEYWVVVRNSTGCTVTSRKIKIKLKKYPAFSFPSRICYGATPFILPNTSLNGITGTWNPSVVSNTTTQNYVFTPTAGQQCVGGNTKSIVVEMPFVAVNDIINTTTSGSSQTVGNIKINDYQGNASSQIYLTSNPNAYTITFPNGIPAGITYNSNGSFTIPAGLAIGTYSFVYKLTSATGTCPNNSSTATVNINILSNAMVGRSTFNFCYSNNQQNTSQTQPNNGNTNLFDAIPGTNNGGYYIDFTGSPVMPPSFININTTTGTFTVAAGTLPTSQVFYYRICAVGTGASEGLIYCLLEIDSPIMGYDDTLVYNTDGVLVSANGIANTSSSPYNVLSNDKIVNCPGRVFQQATASNVVFTPQVFTLNSPFIINTIGEVDPNLQSNYAVGNTYSYTYTIRAIGTPVLEQHTLNISIVATIPFAPNTTTTNSEKRKTNKPVLNSNKNGSPIINFPDPNLRARLLMPFCCTNFPLNTVSGVDLNGDNEIDEYEASQIGSMNLNQANISNLSGIEKFINLKRLGVASNPLLSSVDTQLISSGLEGLGVFNLPITSIDVSYFPNLSQLTTNSSSIISLDTSANGSLAELDPRNCLNLTSIKIKNGSSLDYTGMNMQEKCWENMPALTTICADDFEIPALQSYLDNCGFNTSSVAINDNCALGTENPTTAGFSITPNPSSGVFTITFAEPIGSGVVTVYNMLGQKVFNDNFNLNLNLNLNLDLTSYASGAYLVVIKTESGVMKQTVIKK